jgi:chromosome segregation ATPase
MNETSSPPGVGTSSIESRLHTVAASLRQKRDESHRQQQLAAERLHLATDEYNAVAAAVAAARKNLQSHASGCDSIQKDVATLQQQVAHLTKEVGIHGNDDVFSCCNSFENIKFESNRNDLEAIKITLTFFVCVEQFTFHI